MNYRLIALLFLGSAISTHYLVCAEQGDDDKGKVGEILHALIVARVNESEARYSVEPDLTSCSLHDLAKWCGYRKNRMTIHSKFSEACPLVREVILAIKCSESCVRKEGIAGIIKLQQSNAPEIFTNASPSQMVANWVASMQVQQEAMVRIHSELTEREGKKYRITGHEEELIKKFLFGFKGMYEQLLKPFGSDFYLPLNDENPLKLEIAQRVKQYVDFHALQIEIKGAFPIDELRRQFAQHEIGKAPECGVS